ncbi:MAG: rhomboid family intramembrane serine protease, partial [Bacteroidia bacterium]|nr:rhomboid family intramembrane serine protease [Bacteroidia bacterium]
IGASGFVYGLAFFILGSALIKREKKLMAFAMLVIFLYGSIIWGFFPQFFPEKNISWEGHLSGAISGLIAVLLFSDKGPQKPVYSWELEEGDDTDETDDNDDAVPSSESETMPSSSLSAVAGSVTEERIIKYNLL